MQKKKAKERDRPLIDRAWFDDRMKEQKLSLRQTAAAMAMDPSTLSFTLKGERTIKPQEYARFAEVLKTPIGEVLRHAGIPAPDGRRLVPIAGHLDGSGQVQLDLGGAHEQAGGPCDLPDDAICILCRTAMSPLGQIDGWHLFALPPTKATERILHHLCLVWPKDQASALIAHVRRGYRARAYNLHPLFGELMENVTIDRVAPILWIKSS